MKTSAVAQIYELAQQCADPTTAARAMLETGERHVKLTNRQVTSNKLHRLQNKGLGTRDVEKASKLVIKGKSVRDQGYINYVMGRRWRDAMDQVERARRKHRSSTKFLASILPNHTMGEFYRLMEGYTERLWKDKKDKMKKQIKKLQEDFQPGKQPVPSTIQEIKITDAELAEVEELEEQPEVAIFGGAVVPEAAKAALVLDPKLALHPKIDLKEVEMEVEKGIWKARWEHRNKQERGGGEATEEQEEQELEETRTYDPR